MKRGKNNDFTVTMAAEVLGLSPQCIRVGLQQERLPFGFAVKMSSEWTYHISEKKLKEYIG